jgi:hypothetical protein
MMKKQEQEAIQSGTGAPNSPLRAGLPTSPLRDLESFANVEIKQPPKILSSHQKKIDVTQSTMSKASPVRDLALNIKDIEGAEPRKFIKGEVYNKNRELLSDSVLGRRKHY